MKMKMNKLKMNKLKMNKLKNSCNISIARHKMIKMRCDDMNSCKTV